MFSPELKQEISEAIQKILQSTGHPELPRGEIDFLLHVDGSQFWSWANIRNKSNRNAETPQVLICNINHLAKATARKG